MHTVVCFSHMLSFLIGTEQNNDMYGLYYRTTSLAVPFFTRQHVNLLFVTVLLQAIISLYFIFGV